MKTPDTIQVFEHTWLIVNESYGENKVKFTEHHFNKLTEYLTKNPNCSYYSIYLNRIKFCNYVGVIQVAGLTIEVLPKTDNHEEGKVNWQKVLIEMLAISLKINAKTTTKANIQLRAINVLEAYLNLFLSEVENLLHAGLIKKYRINVNNQNSLKGKLLVHQHITKNMVHAERFYVAHQVYDRDNIYNRILFETLKCIASLNLSVSTVKTCEKLLLFFPECSAINVNEKLFQRLVIDRKSYGYKSAIELARVILLNYHPDIRGGKDNVLAIMFNMNLLWENYIYVMIAKAAALKDYDIQIASQASRYFWTHPENGSMTLRPDIFIKSKNSSFILDTKWKYNQNTTIEDVRQMYAYGKFFNSERRYLLYPEKLDSFKPVDISEGSYFCIDNEGTKSQNEKCGLMYVDLIDAEGNLRKDVGEQIINGLLV